MKKTITNILLSAFVLCSCAQGSAPFPTVTLPYLIATTSTATEFSTATNDATDASVFTDLELSCETFVETRWGNGVNEFGFNENPPNYQSPGPATPTFDVQGNMFIADWANERILVYPKGEKTPKIIHVPDLYEPEFLPGTDYWWSNIIVSMDRIFFLTVGVKDKRNIPRLFALSLKDNGLTKIDLEPYYSPTTNSARLLEDTHGGVYIFMMNFLVHYDKDLHPDLLASDELEKFFYIVRGWDGNLYTAGEPDVIKNWGVDARFNEYPEYVFQDVHATLTGSKDKSVHYIPIGADSAGKLYFVRFFQLYDEAKNEVDIIRFDVQTRTGEFGKIKNKEWLSYYHDYVLAPDGSLYSLIYAPKDSSVQPKIIKCSFGSL
ncbi:MAG TPA: hypothetical protein PLT08_14540 [Anaerolineales bacterium]|nr:hypothetical protein [Anaerolineales bacterium]HNE05741.1 hypothetical protein [Anaerolineales bacterium]